MKTLTNVQNKLLAHPKYGYTRKNKINKRYTTTRLKVILMQF